LAAAILIYLGCGQTDYIRLVELCSTPNFKIDKLEIVQTWFFPEILSQEGTEQGTWENRADFSGPSVMPVK
jgi:hypothetical protein